MSDPDEVEATKQKACVIIGMHEVANRKFGGMSAGVIIASIIIAFLQKSFWPLVVGIVVSFFASYFIRLSCYRRVEHVTGSPRQLQDYFLKMYKHDEQFAEAVHRAWHEYAGGGKKGP